jgi:hypothetical protein
VPEAFGLSASTVSRRFIRASARKLQELSERRLDGYDLVAMLLDGKTFAEDEMVVAVGVTITGEKVLLGFVQTATENRLFLMRNSRFYSASPTMPRDVKANLEQAETAAQREDGTGASLGIVLTSLQTVQESKQLIARSIATRSTI